MSFRTSSSNKPFTNAFMITSKVADSKRKGTAKPAVGRSLAPTRSMRAVFIIGGNGLVGLSLQLTNFYIETHREGVNGSCRESSPNRFRKARAVSAVSSSSVRRWAASGFVSAHSAVSSVSSGLMHSRSVAGGTAPFIRCGVSSYSTSWLRICYRSHVSQLGR